jgi:hypothetical protein
MAEASGDLTDAFDDVCKFEESAFRAAGAVVKHLRRVSKAEAEYARALQGACRDGQRALASPTAAFGTVGTSWLTVVSGHCTLAAVRLGAARALPLGA